MADTDTGTETEIVLKKRQARALDRLALARELGRSTMEQRALGKLKEFDEEQLAGLIEQYGNPEEALTRMAKTGPIGARRAGRLESELGEKYADEAAAQARISASEDIGRGAASIDERLRALGSSVDTGSAAYQSLAARYLQSRDEAQTAANRGIDMGLALAKSQARAGAMSPQALVDIGDTVFALQQLERQEDELKAAQRGAIYSSFINPLAMTGALVGGAVGGRGGAYTGMSQFPASFQGLMQLMSMFSGMGGMGGGVGAPTGAIASNMDAFFPQ